MAREVIAKRVVNEIINMYVNDILDDCGTEGFICWCEDGNVFSEEDEQTQRECIALMNEIADIVDELTYKLVKED